jgi:hypothetical protein
MRISIVIPTRERAVYLRHSLATAAAIDDDALEIVVSDNASNDDTRAVVEAAADPRIRYVNTGQRLSMRQNFEFALGHVTGDYVIFFGDDDGILPGQFPLLRRILEDRRPDALGWDFPVYGWPIEGYGSRVGGLRFRRDAFFGLPQDLDVAARLRAVEAGRLDRLHPLPALYHGCMSRDFLRRLSHPDGTCFLARSPDTWINFRAIQHGGRFLHCHHPFSINGHSPASSGGSLGAQGGGGARDDEPVFRGEVVADPVEDVIAHPKSMVLGFLGTLETVRHHFPDPPVRPDYRAWYRGVFQDMRKKDAATAAEILEHLHAHAALAGAQDQIGPAGGGLGLGLRKLSVTWDKNRAKLGSFRIATAIDGENTILTAARTCDRLIGGDYAAVLAGTLRPRQAWARLKARRDGTAQA